MTTRQRYVTIGNDRGKGTLPRRQWLLSWKQDKGMQVVKKTMETRGQCHVAMETKRTC